MTQTITAKDVAELRGRTGAGRMDCKKALEEANGDMARAAELLRAKGIAKADKRVGRTTSQGLIAGLVGEDGRAGALVELTCETDFVARTDDFGRVAEALLAQVAAGEPMALEAFLAEPAQGSPGKTVADLVKEVSGKTGESVALRHAVKLAPGPSGRVGLYLHHNRQVGVLVELAAATPEVAAHPAVEDLARELAIHVASANPLAVRGEDIDPAVLDRERRIADEQATAEGKPEAVRAKMVEGKVRKFIAEQALMSQPWVKDDKKAIGTLVEEAAKAAGGAVTVSRFVRRRVGEG